ncbi:MAG TPA: hypothetical protein VFL57_06100 [Bryobacteraceae bacterium]|nr:hypothetical protein [Bryobacteraceae bacterium]
MSWRRFARGVGEVQARLLLAIVYYVVLPLFAIVVRFGEDPFQGGWHARADSEPARAARRQS